MLGASPVGVSRAGIGDEEYIWNLLGAGRAGAVEKVSGIQGELVCPVIESCESWLRLPFGLCIDLSLGE